MSYECAGRVTDSEFELLRLLWQFGEPVTFTQIRKGMTDISSWDESTVKTLLRRLCSKKVVLQEKREVYYYYPAISEAEFNEYSNKQFIDRLYSGSAKKLIASLVSEKQLAMEDVEELLSLLRSDTDE